MTQQEQIRFDFAESRRRGSRGIIQPQIRRPFYQEMTFAMTFASKLQDSKWWRVSVWVMLGLVFAPTYPQPVFAQSTETDRKVIEKILRDWKTRRQKFVSLHYKLSGRAMHAKGRFQNDKNGVLPAETFFCDTNVEWLVDFRTNRSRKKFRAHTFHGGAKKFFPSYSDVLCVEKIIKSYQPRYKNVVPGYVYPATQPDLDILPAALLKAYFGLEGRSLLFAFGRVPTRKHPLDPTKLDNRLADADHFELRGRAAFQGQECIIIREKPRHKLENIYEYWVNPSRNSIILRRRVLFLPAHVDSQHDVTYKKGPLDWLPSKIAVTYFGPRGEVQYTQNLHATMAKVNIDFRRESFQIKLNPGDIVEDRVSGGKLLQVQNDGAWAVYDPRKR